MTEVQAILMTGGGFMIINVAGWYLSHLANGRNHAKEEGASEQRLQQVETGLDGLPCQVDPNYMKEQGQLMQKVDDIDERTKRIEGAVNNK